MYNIALFSALYILERRVKVSCKAVRAVYKQVSFVRLCEHGNGFSGCCLRLVFVFVASQISCDIEILNIEINRKVNLSFVQRNTKTGDRTRR
jgi:UDP-N-acetyl-D-mannosaminuronate dehydrogenase